MCELSAQDPDGSEHTELHGANGDSQGVGDFVVGPLFD
jgi:hypothetical protein